MTEPILPTVRLARAGITTSRLGFGTSRLHYLGQRQRQRLLAAAASLGFLHFDTAPAYGDGLAERELGRFLRTGRHRYVIVTKYGLAAHPMIEGVSAALAPPLRIATAFARRIGFFQTPRPPLTPAGLRESAERSLRRLKTDWIDILLLHEPSLERLCDPIGLVEQFEKLRERGLIRAFGIAGSWTGISALQTVVPELAQVVQTAETECPETFSPEITYGAISEGSQSYLADKIGGDVALERLRSALKRRPGSVVIVSTTKINHLHDLAKMANQSLV